MKNYKITYRDAMTGKTKSWTTCAASENDALEQFDHIHPLMYTVLKVETVRM